MDIGIIQQKAEEMRILNLAVMKDGELLLKKDWDEEIRRNQYSASKSFTGRKKVFLSSMKSCVIFSGRKCLKTLLKICAVPR